MARTWKYSLLIYPIKKTIDSDHLAMARTSKYSLLICPIKKQHELGIPLKYYIYTRIPIRTISNSSEEMNDLKRSRLQ